MIVGEQKSLAEIRASIAPYDRILIMGCGTCLKTCFTSGEDEVAVLASALRLAAKKDGETLAVEELTIERQCENAFIQESVPAVARNQAVLSLACGAGVQMLARKFPQTPVLPGADTSFLGVLEKQGVFTEECLGCGDCKLAVFGAVCPVTRCSKKLLNGPCGGSVEGKCEVDPDIDCAWQLIIERLTTLGQLQNLRVYIPPKNWNASHAGGPRKLIREDHIL